VCVCAPHPRWDTRLAYTGKYPIPATRTRIQTLTIYNGGEGKKRARVCLSKITGDELDALHPALSATSFSTDFNDPHFSPFGGVTIL